VTLKQALDQARERLSALTDIEDPGLESEVLLRYTLNLTRAQIYLDLNTELEPALKISFINWVERRLRGEPLAYIIQSREFFGLDFFVDKRVLIPRPETELLVEEALRFCEKHPDVVLADIGTGSGAIAVSLAVHLPEVKIYATDISSMALEVAKLNARKHRVEDRLTFLTGDLLEPLKSPVDALIANLPYVAVSDWQAMPSAAFEPRLALEGGKEGLNQLFRLINRLKDKVNPGGCVLLEIGMGQAEAVKSYLKRFYPAASIDTLKDLADIERVVRMLI
jgi:release factor glutamine methyltransferase